MVNSRCVAGLSTGMRPVSAISTMNIAAKASICDGARNFQLWLTATLAISLKFVELAAKATGKIASIMAVPAIPQLVVVLGVPGPPKQLAGVRAARGAENSPRAQQCTHPRTPAKTLDVT